jgi:cytosine/adenosine deaminase-related metal-dependent hydrolase
MLVDNGRIVAIGTLQELKARHDLPVTHFSGCALIPGFVNAHSHLELTHFPSWRIRKGIDYSPRTYSDWVIQLIKIRRALSADERASSLREGLRISLESGTTTLGEIVSDPALLPLYLATPVSGRLFFEILGHDPLQYRPQLERIAESAASLVGSSFLPGLSPHAPHTVGEGLAGELRLLAERLNLPLAIHLAESPEEVEFFQSGSGRIAELLYPFVGWERYLTPPRHLTPTAWLDHLALLTPQTAAVHGVQLTLDEARLLKERGVGVILCPRSNDRLAVGQPPVPLLRKLGLPLALGTDSLASNDSLSLLDELRFLQELFPDHFTSDELLRLATLDGARLLALDSAVGTLEAGKQGDFLVIRLPRQTDASQVATEILSSGELLKVFVAGRPVSG